MSAPTLAPDSVQVARPALPVLSVMLRPAVTWNQKIKLSGCLHTDSDGYFPVGDGARARRPPPARRHRFHQSDTL